MLTGLSCICTILLRIVAMNSVFDEKDGIMRSFSGASPAHYVLKIQLFSLLAKNVVEKYESGEFEAGGYKWKLVLYPNGNKSKGVDEYISLYLAMTDTSSLFFGWKVYAAFRFFLLDQNKGKYLTVEDTLERERCFHHFKLEWGFDQFLLLKAFNDTCNGYLVEDTCVLGAEVFVRKERSRGKGECLSFIEDMPSFKHVWKIQNFSELSAESYDSEQFNTGGKQWKIVVFPKGRRDASGHLSLFLALADSTAITPASKIYIEFRLRILDQLHAHHTTLTGKNWFSASHKSWGWPRFVSLGYFHSPAAGRLVNDVCMVEAEVTVLGIAKEL